MTVPVWDLVDLPGYDVPDSNLDRKRQFFARGGARGSGPGGLAGGFALVELKGAEHGEAEISDAVGGAEIHLALAEVVDGLPEHLDHAGGILKRQGRKVGGQLENLLGLVAADDSAGAACCRAFLLGRGVVEKTILLAGLGMGPALGSVSTFVAATGLLVGVGFYSKKLCDFHKPPSVSLLGTPEDHDDAELWKISLLIS